MVQLGVATEELNRRWYEANSGQVVTDVQAHVRHPGLRWMAATLDGRLEAKDGPLGGRSDTGRKIRHALEIAGIEFIDENGGEPGVRLRKRQPKK